MAAANWCDAEVPSTSASFFWRIRDFWETPLARADNFFDRLLLPGQSVMSTICLGGEWYLLMEAWQKNVWAAMRRADAMKVNIRIKSDERGGFTAVCPSLPGCLAHAQTREQARQQMSAAIEGYLLAVGEFAPRRLEQELVEVS
jgi:predicted RNase H-like HicB family nuclease